MYLKLICFVCHSKKHFSCVVDDIDRAAVVVCARWRDFDQCSDRRRLTLVARHWWQIIFDSSSTIKIISVSSACLTDIVIVYFGIKMKI